MADHPLRSATHRRLGEPLSHQLANAPQAHPSTAPKAPFNFKTCVSKGHPVLATVSRGYPGLMGRLPTCYSPVRRSDQRSKLLISALDLHVLGTPPAFILSQDQTLHKWKAHLELGRYFRIVCCVFCCSPQLVFLFNRNFYRN